MSGVVAVTIEMSLLIILFSACFFSFRPTRSSMVLLIIFSFTCTIVTLVGYPRSAYHLLLIGVMLFMSQDIAWTPKSKIVTRAGVIVTLAAILVITLIGADWSFASKNNSPHFYTLWSLLIVFGANRRFLGLSRFLMVIDLWIAIQIHYRGLFVRSLFALAFTRKWRKDSKSIVTVLAVCSFVLYVGILPILQLAGKTNSLKTASNVERSTMNYQALSDTVTTPLTMSESAIYYSENISDTNNLSVHCLFLSFGLFNGLFPALLLSLLVLRALRSLSNGPYFPIAINLYFIMLLGPDSFTTRYSLILLACLLVLHRDSGYQPFGVSSSGRIHSPNLL